jgi:hypothetical protein
MSRSKLPAWVTSGASDPDVPLELVLPLPPSGNHAHRPILRRSKRGRLVQGKALTDEAVAYRLLVRYRVRSSALWGATKRSKIEPHPLFLGPVRLQANWVFPDWRRRDGDNYRKQLQDALTGCAWADDVQVVEAVETKRIEAGKAEVTVQIRRAPAFWLCPTFLDTPRSPLPVPPPRDDVEGQRQWAEAIERERR